MTRANYDLLLDIFNWTARDLLRRIKSGEASAQDVANALRLLRDQGIQADPASNEHIQGIVESLPTAFDDDEDIIQENK